jgi:very-short-patch-repair endonuclease
MQISDPHTSLVRLEERWRRGIPTVAAVVANEPSDAETILRAWVDARGLKRIVHGGVPDRLARTAFSGFLESRDPIAAIARRISERTGQGVEALLARLRTDSASLRPEEIASLGRSPALHVAISGVLGPWRNLDQLWDNALQAASLQLLDEAAVAGGFARLMQPDPPPLIVAGAGDVRTALALAAAAQRLVEAVAELRVGLVTNSRTWAALERCDDRCWALVREGLLDSPTMVAAESTVEEVPARLELAAIRQHALTDAETCARSKSLAEQVLFEALERRSLTAGRFTLNGRIAVVFGSSRAEIDLLDHHLAIAVEVDGFYHFRDRDAYRRDRRKDVLLQQEGYLVIRTLADDVLDRLEETVDTITIAVRRRMEPRR